jgi:hypothetical protein
MVHTLRALSAIVLYLAALPDHKRMLSAVAVPQWVNTVAHVASLSYMVHVPRLMPVSYVCRHHPIFFLLLLSRKISASRSHSQTHNHYPPHSTSTHHTHTIHSPTSTTKHRYDHQTPHPLRLRSRLDQRAHAPRPSLIPLSPSHPTVRLPHPPTPRATPARLLRRSRLHERARHRRVVLVRAARAPPGRPSRRVPRTAHCCSAPVARS